MKNKRKYLLYILILILLSINITIPTHATPTEDDDGISVGEQMPPTKPPTDNQTNDNTDNNKTTTEEPPTQKPEENTPDTNEDQPEKNDIIINETPEPTYYTISFDLNGGTGTIPNISIQAGHPIQTLNSNVTKYGYTFTGWYYHNQKIDENTIVYENMNIVAKWEPDGTTPYTIIQKTQKLDGSYENYKEIKKTANADTTIEVTPDNIEGFTSPEKQTVYINADGTTTVTFTYKRNSYKIDLQTMTGVTSKQKTFTYQYNEPVTLNVYLEENYTNLTIKGDVSEKKFKMPAKNITLIISADPETYKIKYKGYGIATDNLTKSYSIETLPVKLNTPTTTNEFYKFNGWTYDGKPITEITDTSHTDMIIKADMSIQWKKVTPWLLLLSTPIFILYFIIKSYGKERRKL